METSVEGEPSIPGPFDVRTLKYLVRLMGRHDLTEIDLRDGDHRIRLRRGPKDVITRELNSFPAPFVAMQPQQTVAPTSAPVQAPAKPVIEIKSPTPGTFYTAATPDTDPFVKVGSRVEPSTVVCIIEAMKVFNEITADCTGTVTAILVENQQAVEYGQVLFKVDPT